MGGVIHIRRRPSGWETAGQAMMEAVGQYHQGGVDIAKDQGDMTMQLINSLLQKKQMDDVNTRDDKRWEQNSSWRAEDMAWEKEKWGAELGLRKENNARAWTTHNKPLYDPRLGGFVNSDGSFNPVQIPDGYTPPGAQTMPQKSNADLAKEAYAQSILVPEEQRNENHRLAIELGKAYGIKPEQTTGAYENLSQAYTPAEFRQARSKRDSIEVMNQTLELYENAVKKYGWTPTGLVDPKAEQELDSLQRDFQMQLKEMYNLGVLNGPDLELMNQIMPSATEIPNNPLRWWNRQERLLEGTQQARGLMNRYQDQANRILGVQPATDTKTNSALPPGFKVVQ